MNDMQDEDPAPDLGPDLWMNDNIHAAITNLMEILYDDGASVNGMEIHLPLIPGDELTITTDYGQVSIIGKDL